MIASSTAAVAGTQDHHLRRPLACVALALAGLPAVLALPHVDGALLPLSLLTAQWTQTWLTWLGIAVSRDLTLLSHAGGFACDIHHTCTALVPLVLLSSAIVASRLSLRRRALGLVCGGAMMILANQVRLTTLVWCGVRAPQWLDLMHAWLWPALLTGAGVLYWRLLHWAAPREFSL